ncbi:thioesterase [Aliidiomarina shirensis]|uniref:Thioesterase n=1 Tax=Aliidiomarina shirensis TaxID=1048642 RepID=A0A432WWH7_9GAMM|nr:acyl-CoA thioesterase [Aliidiomarina shirensis]RUO38122.1 thioesterase [Aliidiomarina shirensis]
MNLLIRLFWILLSRRKEPQCGAFDTLRVCSRVYPNDLDLNMHVNNGRFLTFADLGRVDWFFRSGAWGVARKKGFIPVIGDVNARFIRQLKAFDRFYVETRLLGWDDKWAFLEHKILDKNDRVAGLIVVRGMFWSKKHGGLKPVDLIEATGNAKSEELLESPALPEWVEKWRETLDSLSATARKEKEIQRSLEDR